MFETKNTGKRRGYRAGQKTKRGRASGLSICMRSKRGSAKIFRIPEVFALPIKPSEHARRKKLKAPPFRIFRFHTGYMDIW